MSQELFKSIEAGNLEKVKSLLASGADVNIRSVNGFTPLHWSAVYGRTDIVGELLSSGADVNAKDSDGKTPLHLAIKHGYTSIVQLLRVATEEKVNLSQERLMLGG
jgi:ankyrin repeat protein